MKGLLSIFLVLAVLATCLSCGETPDVNPTNEEKIELLLSVPAEINGAAGDVITVNYFSGKGPKQGDEVLFKRPSVEIVCQIVAIESDHFSFTLPKELESGKYSFCIRRGDQVKTVRDVTCTIEHRAEVEQKDGYNVYGLISCDGTGVPGVVVSDGEDVTVTDENGVYYLNSKESNQVVFMSVPAGYEAEVNGVLPKFHKVLDGNPYTTERADWNLVQVDNADHILYVLGDMHLANRTNDINQFNDFATDIKTQVNANKAKRQYAITLGDMTWDLYWYSNAFDLYTYVETVNSKLSGLQVYHTIGNHDHDMNSAGDFNTVSAFKNAVAPTYYSFNIGNVHYIVLDDILCTNDGTGNRTYDSSLTVAQLDWLRKDLSYVDKSKTLVITMHAQMYNEGGSAAIQFSSQLEELVKGYKTHVMTAHTHVIWNNDKTASTGIMHHNSSAICGTWWWTGYYTAGHNICKDGSPAGYYVYDMSGNDVKWRFKPIGKDFKHMFRTYDGNEIVLSAAQFAPKADASNAAAFEKSASSWAKANSDNYVYFNVYDYDPSWTIEVTENGKALTPKVIKIKDPLHLISYEAMRYNVNSTPTSSFLAREVQSHIFRVQASSATSTLEFKITDRFGNVSTETMKRPKAFSLNAYK